MTKNCTSCGCQLTETEGICPNCGKPFEESQPVFQQPEKKSKSKVKWWMIVIPAVLVLGILVAVLWAPLSLRFAPKVVLAAALAEAAVELGERNEGSPILLLNSIDLTQGYTFLTSLHHSDGSGADSTVSISSYYDIINTRSRMDLELTAMEMDLDLSVYLDSDSLALTSESLTDGAFYGVTFDTFSEDIQSNALFASLDQETIDAIQDYFDLIQTGMDNSAEQAGYSEEYLTVLTDFVTGLEPVLASGTRSINGEEKSCDSLAFTVDAQQLAQLFEDLTEVLESDEALKEHLFIGYTDSGEATEWEEAQQEIKDAITNLRDTVDGEFVITFFLRRNHLVGISVDVDFEGEENAADLTADISLGGNAAQDDIVIDCTMIDPEGSGEEVFISCTLNTEKSENSYAETLHFSVTDEYDLTTNAELSYNWNKSTSDLTLAFISDDGSEEHDFQLDMNLAQTEDGFRLSVEDLLAPLTSLNGDPDTFIGQTLSFSMRMVQGAQVETPEYKNIDDWSESDLMSILMKMYSMVGLA